MIADPIILWCPSLRLAWWLQARQHHPFFHCSQQVMVAIRPEAATLQQLQQHQIYRILAENQSGTMHKFSIHLTTLWNYVALLHECHLPSLVKFASWPCTMKKYRKKPDVPGTDASGKWSNNWSLQNGTAQAHPQGAVQVFKFHLGAPRTALRGCLSISMQRSVFDVCQKTSTKNARTHECK